MRMAIPIALGLGAAVTVGALMLRGHGAGSRPPTRADAVPAESAAAAETLPPEATAASLVQTADPQVRPADAQAARETALAPKASAGSSPNPASKPESAVAENHGTPLGQEAPREATAPSGSPAAVEATVLKVEEDGVVTFQAEAGRNSGDDDWAFLLQDVVQSRRGTASWELLHWFQATPDPEAKADVLSTASLLDPDPATRLLLQYALAPTQPEDLRLAALAHAAEREPDLLLGYAADPVLQVPIESIFDDPQLPDESHVIGANSHPPLSPKLAPPPPDANHRP
jgi:hypothetical protein